MSDRIESDDQTSAAGAAAPARTPRTAAQEREAREHADSPDALVAEIERTRDDLAETMDAIVDKVSPKKVAQRSKEKATETVKEKVAAAKEAVSEKAAVALDVVTEKTAAARETVSERAATAKEAVAEKTAQVRESHSSNASSVAIDPAGGTSLPPTTGVPVPPLPTDRPAYGTVPSTSGGASSSPTDKLSAYLSKVPPVRKEVLAGGALALIALLLLRRRGSDD